MDFLELCARRQSCRKFDPARKVEHEKLVKCVEAGRLAPSACNSQPWRFVVVEDPEVVAKVAKSPQSGNRNQFCEEVGAFIVILEEHAQLMPDLRATLDSQYFAKGDLGIAAAHICLEAADQGLGTCMMGIFNRDMLGEALGLPLEQRYYLVIAVGYPASEEIRPKKRKSLDEVARFL